eukprot:6214441-Pleurochrysis_carterae.AAC.1
MSRSRLPIMPAARGTEKHRPARLHSFLRHAPPELSHFSRKGIRKPKRVLASPFRACYVVQVSFVSGGEKVSIWHQIIRQGTPPFHAACCTHAHTNVRTHHTHTRKRHVRMMQEEKKCPCYYCSSDEARLFRTQEEERKHGCSEEKGVDQCASQNMLVALTELTTRDEALSHGQVFQNAETKNFSVQHHPELPVYLEEEPRRGCELLESCIAF